jgi:hypothetical protein
VPAGLGPRHHEAKVRADLLPGDDQRAEGGAVAGEGGPVVGAGGGKSPGQGLVMPDGAQPPDGFRMPAPGRIDWEQQADRALDAFRRNGFFILIDARQVTDLEEVLELTAESDIGFLRLVQPVGGWPALGLPGMM